MVSRCGRGRGSGGGRAGPQRRLTWTWPRRYGRVLVERIEGFCATEDWQRAFSEINDFEEQARRPARPWPAPRGAGTVP